MKDYRFFQWGVIFLIIISLLFLLLYFQNTMNNHDDKNTRNFTLIDQYGVERSTSEFRGKYILIYFGYTSCNGSCHTILQNISKALKIINNKSDEIMPIFVTIHPERDTIDHLKTYAKNFDQKFIMMTGTPEQIAAVLKKYKVYQLKVKPNETIQDPFIEHSTLVYLLDRNGALVKFFDQKNMSSTDLVNEIKSILDKE